jgi:DNA primase
MRAEDRAILVEGQVDVVSMHQRGHGETVAPLGTALTKAQCELLARFVTTVVLCFDGDAAGAKAAYAAVPLLLDEGLDVRIAALDAGEDPDSVDPEKIENLLSRPRPAILWFVDRMIVKGARESIDAQARALRALVPLLRKVKGRDARGDYANLAADMLQIPARRVWAAVEQGGQRRQHRSHPNHPSQGGGDPRDQVDAGPHTPGPHSEQHRGSQFSAGMPHSAPMRLVQPLPSGQASVTALLVDRPELARVAEREGVLDRVIRAALDGESIPSEGELLELVDPAQHRMLHDRVFGHEYMEVEDPNAVLAQGLVLCERDELEREVRGLESELAQARMRGDQQTVHELARRRMAARRRRAELDASLARARN